MSQTSILRPLLLIALALLSGCAAPKEEWSLEGRPNHKGQLWVSDGYPTFVQTCYSTDGEALVIRKGKLDGPGQFPDNFRVTAQRRIPLPARDLWVFNMMTAAGMDVWTHEEEARRRKDIADGPYYQLIVDGKTIAEGWTPTFDRFYLNVCEFILNRELERETR
jgi:hypothetical protein